MGALPRPNVPDGPIRELFDRLHELHHVAGWPSLREMAREIGCSHTTVSAAFSEPRVPRWGMLELVVETLGGDTEDFHRLWLAATGTGQATPQVPAPQPPLSVTQPTVVAPGPPVPRQLPADVAGFTGRGDTLAALDDLLAQRGATPLVQVSGTAGVGKTATAIHWAHRVADRFPDGQLYLDLRGYGRESPVPAGEALEVLLRSLGVEGPAVPRDAAERAARYRTLLADRRILLVLDNAHAVDQVRDLLPGGRDCFVVVTSRTSMPALVARHGAVRLDLDLLPADDALMLLRRLVGARVDEEPDAAARLIARCARLPLALRVAAELAVARPHTFLQHLLEELDTEAGALDLLTAGEDEGTGVRAVLSWSLRNLSPAAADLFAHLGIHPGADLDLATAAALVGSDGASARRALDELRRAHLVIEQGPGRYSMHDLLREYAAELAALFGGDEQKAWARLCDHYLAAAAAAMDAAFAPSRHQRPAVEERPPTTPDFATASSAREWLAAEWRNVVATAHAREDARSAYLRDVAAIMAEYLDEQAQYDEALALHQRARFAAAEADDRSDEAVALNNLAAVSRRLGRYDEAVSLHQSSLAAHQEAGDVGGQARALHGIGVLAWRQGHYRAATERLAEAVGLFEQADDAVGQGTALYALGVATRRLGRYADAEAHHRRAIALLHEAGDSSGEARARNNLGVMCMFLGRYDEALEHLTVSQARHTEMADRLGVAVAVENIATVRARTGRWEESLALHREALELCLVIGSRVGEGDVRRGLGVALGGLGRHEEAVVELGLAVAIGREIGEADIETAALVDLGDELVALARTEDAAAAYVNAEDLAARAGDRYAQARVLAGVAALKYAAGDVPAALRMWAEAMDEFAHLGVPEASQVRACLAAVEATTP